jgi:hypothetical protein
VRVAVDHQEQETAQAAAAVRVVCVRLQVYRLLQVLH